MNKYLKILQISVVAMFFAACDEETPASITYTISADKYEVGIGENVIFAVHSSDGRDVTSASLFCETGDNGMCFTGNTKAWSEVGEYEIVGHYFDDSENAPVDGYETSNTVKIIVRQQENDGNPSIAFSGRQVEIPFQGGSFTVWYELENPVEGAELKVGAAKDWVTVGDCSKPGILEFTVPQYIEKNSRSSAVDVRYEYGEGKCVDARFSIVQTGVNSKIELSGIQVDASYKGGNFVMDYTVSNPVEGAVISATSVESWVENIDCSEEGKIRFSISENTTDASRNSSVDLTYCVAEGIEVKARFKVVQRSAIVVNDFRLFKITYQGDLYGEGNHVYTAEILDKNLTNGYLSGDTKQVYLVFVSDKAPDVQDVNKPIEYDKLTIPDGKYIVGNSGTNRIAAAKSFVRIVNSTGTGYVLDTAPVSGSVIVKNHAASIEVSATVTDAENHDWVLDYDGEPTEKVDPRFLSSLENDVDVDFSEAGIQAFYAGLSKANTTCWAVQITNGNNEFVQIEFYAGASQTFEKGFPTGEFTVSENGAENTFLTGFIANNRLLGSWYATLTSQGALTYPYAPMDGGKISVTKSGNDYTITLAAKDDVGYNITGTWNGSIEVSDASKSASYQPYQLKSVISDRTADFINTIR